VVAPAAPRRPGDLIKLLVVTNAMGYVPLFGHNFPVVVTTLGLLSSDRTIRPRGLMPVARPQPLS
jgi:hypothetical protein